MKRFFILTLIGVMCFAIVSCSKNDESKCPAQVKATPEIRLGYLQSDLHQLAAFVALKKGFFEAEDLNVKVAGVFKAGPEEMSAFVAGGLDVGYVGEAPATTAVANGSAGVTVLAQANLEGSAIVIGRNSKLKSVKELKGKTVAVPGHSTVQDFLLRKAISQSGMKLSDVRIIVVKPPEMITTLERGDIDAFIAWEPYPARAISLKIGKVLIYSGAIWPKHPCCVLVVKNEFKEMNSGLVKKLVRAHVRATQYIKDNPEEAVKLGMQFTGMEEQAVREAFKSIEFEVNPSIQGETEYVDFLRELKYIKVDDPKAFTDKFIDDSILKEVKQEK